MDGSPRNVSESLTSEPEMPGNLDCNEASLTDHRGLGRCSGTISISARDSASTCEPPSDGAHLLELNPNNGVECKSENPTSAPPSDDTGEGSDEIPPAFIDDGTLALLSISCTVPQLQSVFRSLTASWIPEYAAVLKDFRAWTQQENAHCAGTNICPRKLLARIRHLGDDLSQTVISLDCLDIGAFVSGKEAIRQSRKELIRVLEVLGGRCDVLLHSSLQAKADALSRPTGLGTTAAFQGVPSLATVHEKSRANELPAAPIGRLGVSVPGSISAPPTFTRREAVRSTRFSDAPPRPPDCRQQSDPQRATADGHSSAKPMVGGSASNKRGFWTPPGRRNEGPKPAPNSDTDEDHTRKRPKSKKAVDWTIKVKEKIDLFKAHTSHGGCVTALYDQPVSRDALLALLSKCEEALGAPDPTPVQMKMAIETFIAALDCAFGYLQQLRVNKTQLRLLYQSALILDRLSSPADLLPELRSIQGLLKTFGMF